MELKMEVTREKLEAYLGTKLADKSFKAIMDRLNDPNQREAQIASLKKQALLNQCIKDVENKPEK
jgi:hypothetical protein